MGHQGDVCIDALALDLMRITDDGCLRHFGMRHQRAFDFGRAHAVAGNVDDVVDAAGDPVIAILVPAAAIPGEIMARICREIGLHESFMIPIDGPHLAGPGIGDAEVALANAFLGGSGCIDDLRLHPEEGPAGGSRL